MIGRLVTLLLVVAVMAFVFPSSSFSESKEALLEQANKAKPEYYAKKYEIDNKIRVLNREWHMKQLETYEKIKADPSQARALRAELWQGAKELSKAKKELYDQLTPLRKQWYQTRMDVEAKVTAMQQAETEAAQK